LLVQPNNDILYREWAPNATEAFVIGDFNHWDRNSHRMAKNQFGVFEILIPAINGQPAVAHDSKIKVHLTIFKLVNPSN
jgi:1,4-alpha-glucan branching enzyme